MDRGASHPVNEQVPTKVPDCDLRQSVTSGRPSGSETRGAVGSPLRSTETRRLQSESVCTLRFVQKHDVPNIPKRAQPLGCGNARTQRPDSSCQCDSRPVLVEVVAEKPP